MCSRDPGNGSGAAMKEAGLEQGAELVDAADREESALRWVLWATSLLPCTQAGLGAPPLFPGPCITPEQHLTQA